jgi:DNA-binding NtrC family response regulator
MPDLSGVELLQVVKSRDPHVQVVIMTGYGTIANAVEAI